MERLFKQLTQHSGKKTLLQFLGGSIFVSELSTLQNKKTKNIFKPGFKVHIIQHPVTNL